MLHSFFTPSHHKMVIYQLMLRLFGNNNQRNKPYGTIKENGSGKFDDVTVEALTSLKELGVTHIWFTGVLEHSSTTGYPKYKIPADDPYIVKGRAGSPYAIRDYYDVSADLANNINHRIEEFESMIQRTHQSGIKTIIDFVPNHVARSYHSDKKPSSIKDLGEGDDETKFFSPQNNFLYLQNETFKTPSDYIPLGGNAISKTVKRFKEFPAKVTGNDVYSSQPSSNDWFETIKFNFGVNPHSPHECFFDPVPDTWQKLLDILLYWCKKGVDGFRCDMAEMVPAEFWEWIIPCVKTHFPDTIFIAEIYKPELYERYLDRGNFDYIYDKVRLYDTLLSVLKNETSADELTNCARSIDQFPERMLSFLENHDEVRLAWKGLNISPLQTIPAVVLCATLSKGPVMIYNGQEVAEPANDNLGFAGDRGRSSIFDYGCMPELCKWMNNGKYDGGLMNDEQLQLRKFYAKILNLSSSMEAIYDGSFYDLQYINRFGQSEGFDERYIFAFLRYTKNERLLIVANFNKVLSYDVSIKIPADAFKNMNLSIQKDYTFNDLLSGNYEKKFSGKEISKEKEKTAGVTLKAEAGSVYMLKFG